MDEVASRELVARLSMLSLTAHGLVEVHPKLESTSTRLQHLAAQGAESGSLVVARCQTKGRGRLGRSFASPDGGLYASILLRELDQPGRAPATLLLALAISQAIDEIARVATWLKWPNDILLNDKKVAGILAEAGRDGDRARLVLGFGVNVNTGLSAFPLVLRGTATSLLLETGENFELDEVLRASLAWFQAHLRARQENKGDYIIAQIADRMPTLGKSVRAKIGNEVITGEAMALTSTGALVVMTRDGRKIVSAGEIEELRTS